MSWIFSGRRVGEQTRDIEIMYGVNFVVKRIEGDIVIEGRARTASDITRLKRLAEEIFNEVLREYEGKRSSPAHLKRY